MSYDIYCYKSSHDTPNEDEANAVIEADIEKWSKKDMNPATKLAIVKALKAFNPKLEIFDFDYGEIAELTVAIIEENDSKFHHIEINHPEGEPAVQLVVYDNHVFLTAPYLHVGSDANQLFQYIRSYIKIIRETAGYFVYDPQTGTVFDPAMNEFDGLDKYLSVSNDMDEIIAGKSTNQLHKKPWWKFW